MKTADGLWKDIFPVVFHVDYWDGLGWPDRFARAEFTQRQRDYADRLGQDSVYTPEFIANGAEWRRGWLNAQLPATGAEKSGHLALTVQMKTQKCSANYQPASPATDENLTLNVALLGFNVVTDVKRGENGGRKLQHDFVVLGFRSVALVRDHGIAFQSDPVEIANPTGEKPGAVVAWVSGPNGKILQIAGGWLSTTVANGG